MEVLPCSDSDGDGSEKNFNNKEFFKQDKAIKQGSKEPRQGGASTS